MRFIRRINFEEFVKKLPIIFADLAKRGEVIIVEKEGKTYRLEPEEEDIWAGYDPKKVKVALKKHAGFLSKKEADKMIADIYAARETGSRPPDRP